LDKKAPRNISVSRLLWFSVGKKVYKINTLTADDDSIRIFQFEKVKFNHLKNLMSDDETDVKVALQGLN